MTTLEEIKRLYYGATRATIARDFDRAIELLKSMSSEEERERATVYMQGLADMRSQWLGKSAKAPKRRPRPT
jgi:hypothetical protein